MHVIPTQKPRLAVIVGPTAVGKTQTGMKYAFQLGGEIVNADSMQVYRRMDIGTAKPSANDRTAVPHHLIDIVDPDEDFNVSIFVRLARNVIHQLHDRSKPVFVVGGTGLYIRALIGGLLRSQDPDYELREFYRSQVNNYGIDYLYGQLQTRDPESAFKINPHDTVRIIRALEVLDLMGHPIAELQRSHQFMEKPYIVLKIGLTMEKQALFQRIDERIDQMIKGGLIEEVRMLLQMGYDETCKAMQSLGYRHILAYLKGSLTLDDAVRRMKRDSRSYAKRQMTWFKKEPDIHWFLLPDNMDRIGETISTYFLE
jgi:tRNA dimethylallyltransferase